MENSWKKVFNITASDHYLMSKGSGTIVQTDFSDEEDVMHMVDWCKDNVTSTWSYAKLPEYNYMITFRFFDYNTAFQFKDEFSL